MPIALLALSAGAFAIGTTEFVIMGLLLQVSADLHVSIAAAGLLISGYAIGVAVGAPLLTIATRSMPRKAVLLALMVIFTLGNLACALAPGYLAKYGTPRTPQELEAHNRLGWSFRRNTPDWPLRVAMVSSGAPAATPMA